MTCPITAGAWGGNRGLVSFMDNTSDEEELCSLTAPQASMSLGPDLHGESLDVKLVLRLCGFA